MIMITIWHKPNKYKVYVKLNMKYFSILSDVSVLFFVLCNFRVKMEKQHHTQWEAEEIWALR